MKLFWHLIPASDRDECLRNALVGVSLSTATVCSFLVARATVAHAIALRIYGRWHGVKLKLAGR